MGTTCSTDPMYYLNMPDGIEQCISWCKDELACLGFTQYDNDYCLFWENTCTEGTLEAKDDATTYIKN